MTTRAREQHRELDRAFAKACARDGEDGPDLARPIRFRRKDLMTSNAMVVAIQR
jgi:hypothetical protein